MDVIGGGVVGIVIGMVVDGSIVMNLVAGTIKIL